MYSSQEHTQLWPCGMVQADGSSPTHLGATLWCHQDVRWLRQPEDFCTDSIDQRLGLVDFTSYCTYIHTYTHKSSKQPYCLCHRVEIRVGCSTMCHPGQESKPFSLGRCLRADITAFFIPNFADNGPPLLDNFCQGKPERVHLQPFTLSSLQLNWRVNDLEQ